MFNFDDNVRATIVLLNRLGQKYKKIIIFAIYHSISFYRQFSPRPIRPICRTFYVNIQILKGIFLIFLYFRTNFCPKHHL